MANEREAAKHRTSKKFFTSRAAHSPNVAQFADEYAEESARPIGFRQAEQLTARVKDCKHQL
jgi:hypothetical protein